MGSSSSDSSQQLLVSLSPASLADCTRATPAPVHTVVRYAEYMNGRHCGYCGGESISAKTTERQGSALYSVSISSLPITLITNPSDIMKPVRAVPVGLYSEMLNRGFRRSGSMFYKIDQRNSCCPQYTMRLLVSKFKPSRDHRKALNRFNRWVLGELETNLLSVSSKVWENPTAKSKLKPSAQKKKKKQNEEYNLPYNVHRIDTDFDHLTGQDIMTEKGLYLFPNDFSYETAGSLNEKKGKKGGKSRQYLSTCRPDFQVTLKLSKATPEKFELYRRYQVAIHKDEFDEVTMDSFDRFLCKSPLNSEPPAGVTRVVRTDTADRELTLADIQELGGGSFHQEYRYMGKLIAFGVLDIIPGNCVSSVYLVWDPDYAELELGKVSVLREVVLTQDLQLPYYCLGLYVPSCPKMVYKSSFHPTELLDPMAIPAGALLYQTEEAEIEDQSVEQLKDNRWIPFEEFSSRWDQDGTHTDWYVSVLEEKTPPPREPPLVHDVKITNLLGCDGNPSLFIERTQLFDVDMPGIIPFDNLVEALQTRFDFFGETNICFDTSGGSNTKYLEMTTKELLAKYPMPRLFEILLEFVGAVGLDLAPHFSFRLL